MAVGYDDETYDSYWECDCSEEAWHDITPVESHVSYRFVAGACINRWAKACSPRRARLLRVWRTVLRGSTRVADRATGDPTAAEEVGTAEAEAAVAALTIEKEDLWQRTKVETDMATEEEEWGGAEGARGSANDLWKMGARGTQLVAAFLGVINSRLIFLNEPQPCWARVRRAPRPFIYIRPPIAGSVFFACAAAAAAAVAVAVVSSTSGAMLRWQWGSLNGGAFRLLIGVVGIVAVFNLVLLPSSRPIHGHSTAAFSIGRQWVVVTWSRFEAPRRDESFDVARRTTFVELTAGQPIRRRHESPRAGDLVLSVW